MAKNNEPQPAQAGEGANEIAHVANATDAAVNASTQDGEPVTYINAAGVKVDPDGAPVEDKK